MEISNSSSVSNILKTINKEFDKIAQNASKVAGYALDSEAASTSSLAEPLIEITQSEQAVKAGLVAIKKINEIEDEVLNIIA